MLDLIGFFLPNFVLFTACKFDFLLKGLAADKFLCVLLTEWDTFLCIVDFCTGGLLVLFLTMW